MTDRPTLPPDAARVAAAATRGCARVRANVLAGLLERHPEEAPDPATSEAFHWDHLLPGVPYERQPGEDELPTGTANALAQRRTDHLRFVLRLALAYHRPGGPHHREAVTLDAVAGGLRRWMDLDCRPRQNWWFRKIGFQRPLSEALAVMAEPLRERHPAVLADALTWGRFPWDDGVGWLFGANAQDVARSTILTAAAAEDGERLRVAAELAASMIAPRTTYLHPASPHERKHTEGFQVDLGFNQHAEHGRQPQLGSYGLSFLEQTLNLAAELRGTPWAFPPEAVRWLERYCLGSVAWLLRRGRVDPTRMGRTILRPERGPEPPEGVTRPAAHVHGMLTRLAALGGADAAALHALAATLPTDSDAEGVVGHRVFWRFDLAVHRRRGFHVSHRMSSTRTVANETLNGEGEFNEHTGSGWTAILTDGRRLPRLLREQDWERLPGTTTRVTGRPPRVPDRSGAGAGGDDFAGGVSDGGVGASAFAHRRLGVEARKAVFSSDRGFVALAAGISAGDGLVVTNINQRLWLPSQALRTPSGPLDLKPGEPGKFQGVDRLHHDGIGYASLDGRPFTVEARPIASEPDDAEEEEASLLLLGFPHGTPRGASCAYRVEPGAEAEPFLASPGPPGFLNTTACQAVLFAAGDCGGKPTLQAVFHEAGAHELPGGVSVGVDGPSLVMVRFDEGRGSLAFSVASPFADRRAVRAVALDVAFAAGSPFPAGGHHLRVELPQGFHAGQTVSVTRPTG